jgi:hypothetical protein
MNTSGDDKQGRDRRMKIQRVKLKLVVALSLVIFLGCDAAVSKLSNQVTQNPSPSNQDRSSSLIVPGRSVGPVQLGDTRERAFAAFSEVFGQKYFEEETLSSSSSSCFPRQCCDGIATLRWLDFDKQQNGVSVYVSKDRVLQIKVATTRYATAADIKHDSPPEEIRRYYPGLQAHMRLGYHSEAEGGRDVIYWDDHTRGIAFEFWYERKANKRYLEAIIVYQPGAPLIPEDCTASASDWRQLEPFALELTTSRPR